MSFRITSPSSLSIGTVVSGGTEGSVLFFGPSGVIAQDNTNLFFDDTNNALRPTKLVLGYNTNGSGGVTFATGSFFATTAPTSANTEAQVTLFAKGIEGYSTPIDNDTASNGGGFYFQTGLGGSALGDGGTGGDGGSLTIVLSDGGTGLDQAGSSGQIFIKNTAGTILGRFNDGSLTLTGGLVATSINANSSQTGILTYKAGTSGNAAGNIPLQLAASFTGTVIAGFGLRTVYTSQWGTNLQTSQIGSIQFEWDDVSSSGALKGHVSFSFWNGGTGGQKEGARVWTDGTQANFVVGDAAGIASTRLTVYPGVSTYKGMIIRGAASQSANLMELQDSTTAILSSHDAAGRLRFDTASAGVTNEGALWADSTQKAMQVYVDGIEQTLSGTIFTQTADATVANTLTETTIFGTGTGTLTLPAAFFVAGKTVRIMMSGVYSTVAVTGDTVTVKIKYGSTVIASKATTGLLTGATNNYWFAEAIITCRTTGSSGTVQCSGGVRYQVASSVVVEDELNNSAATTTINTTTSNAIDVTVTHSAANASNSVKSLVASVEVLN